MRAPAVLAATALLTALLLVVTVGRVPTPFADLELYGSIVRSVQLFGTGVPSVISTSPSAVDHVPFYGPVFFRLAALSSQALGFSLTSVRLVSLAGAFLFVAAGVLLARQLTGDPVRGLWALVLLLLSPEARGTATDGSMFLLSVGLEMLALAVFVRGLAAGPDHDRYRWHGAGSGLLLALAALTTPRTYPFVFAFGAACVMLPLMIRNSGRAALGHGIAALAILALVVTGWAIASHGSVAGWARYMAFILTHEDTDVAILPASVRYWSFSWSVMVSPVFAAIAGLAAAWQLHRVRPASATMGAAVFALAVGWMTFVGSVLTMNYTLMCGAYFALPLLAVVLALPWTTLRVPPRLVAAGAVILLAFELGIAAVGYARVAATWAARDPDPLVAFFRANVPPGSAVVGPEAPYFFAVENSGARYLAIAEASWADWARWVPLVEPQAAGAGRRALRAETQGRFFVWPADDELPDRYACARPDRVAVFTPAANHLDLLGWIGQRTGDRGYPESVLYRLSPGCPIGYDPTRPAD